MERIKICEICGKEVVPKRDKHLNIVNKYYHDACLGKEKTIKKNVTPDFSKDQVERMTFEEKLAYLDERIRCLTTKYNVPEEEAIQTRMILRQLFEQYGAVAKKQDKNSKSSSK